MWKNKKVSIVLPAYNEASGIKTTIEEFFATGIVDEIIVVDAKSKDNTVEEVKKTNAKLIIGEIPGQGYGWAIRTGLKSTTGDYIITAESDGTFVGDDIAKLLTYADRDIDVVFGSRTHKEFILPGAEMNLIKRIADRIVAKFLQYIHKGPPLTDTGCTLKLITHTGLEKIKDKFTQSGSTFSPDFMITAIKNGLSCVQIPVHYRRRIGRSKLTGSFLKNIKLGLAYLRLIVFY